MAEVLRPQWFPVSGRRARRPRVDGGQGLGPAARPRRDRPRHRRRRHAARCATWAIVIAVVGVVLGAFTGLRRYLGLPRGALVETDLRDRLFAHLQRLHFAFHDQAQTGQLMSRANTDLQQIQAFVVMIPLTISNVRHRRWPSP